MIGQSVATERCDIRGGAERDDTLEISMVNDLRKVDGVTAQIEEFCAARNLAPGIALVLNMAVDELLAGTIAYAYDDDESHRIEIIVCQEGDWLVVVMADDGRALDAWPAPKPVAGASIVEAMSAGARSLFLARTLVEGVHYRRTEGCNVVTLTKCTRR